MCYPLTAYRVSRICVELFARELFDRAEGFFFSNITNSGDFACPSGNFSLSVSDRISLKQAPGNLAHQIDTFVQMDHVIAPLYFILRLLVAWF